MVDMLPKAIRAKIAGPVDEKLPVVRSKLESALAEIRTEKYERNMLYRTAVDTLVLALERQWGPVLQISRRRLHEVFRGEVVRNLGPEE